MKEKKLRGKEYDRDILTKEIVQMRIKGASTNTIILYLTEKVGMCKKLAYDILRDVHQEFIEMMRDRNKSDFEEAVAYLEHLLENTYERKVQLEIAKELNKLKGVYKANKIDITTNGKDITVNEVVIHIINSKDDLKEKDED